LGTSSLTIFPLFTATPVASGGLGWDVGETAIAFALRGFALIVVQLFVFVPLSRRLGWTRFFRTCAGAEMLLEPADSAATYCVVVLSPILANAIARAGFRPHAEWVVMAPLVVLWSASNQIVAVMAVLTNALAPSPRELGTLQGPSTDAAAPS